MVEGQSIVVKPASRARSCGRELQEVQARGEGRSHEDAKSDAKSNVPRNNSGELEK
jgi:hypothetical protein